MRFQTSLSFEIMKIMKNVPRACLEHFAKAFLGVLAVFLFSGSVFGALRSCRNAPQTLRKRKRSGNAGNALELQKRLSSGNASITLRKRSGNAPKTLWNARPTPKTLLTNALNKCFCNSLNHHPVLGSWSLIVVMLFTIMIRMLNNNNEADGSDDDDDDDDVGDNDDNDGR